MYFDKNHCGVIKTQFQERIASDCGNILIFDKISSRVWLRYIVLISRIYFRKIVPRVGYVFENTKPYKLGTSFNCECYNVPKKLSDLLKDSLIINKKNQRSICISNSRRK